MALHQVALLPLPKPLAAELLLHFCPPHFLLRADLEHPQPSVDLLLLLLMQQLQHWAVQVAAATEHQLLQSR